MNPYRARRRTCGREVRVAIQEPAVASRRLAVAVRWPPAVALAAGRKPRPQRASQARQDAPSLPPTLNWLSLTLSAEPPFVLAHCNTWQAADPAKGMTEEALPACNLCR